MRLFIFVPEFRPFARNFDDVVHVWDYIGSLCSYSEVNKVNNWERDIYFPYIFKFIRDRGAWDRVILSETNLGK